MTPEEYVSKLWKEESHLQNPPEEIDLPGYKHSIETRRAMELLLCKKIQDWESCMAETSKADILKRMVGFYVVMMEATTTALSFYGIQYISMLENLQENRGSTTLEELDEKTRENLFTSTAIITMLIRSIQRMIKETVGPILLDGSGERMLKDDI